MPRLNSIPRTVVAALSLALALAALGQGPEPSEAAGLPQPAAASCTPWSRTGACCPHGAVYGRICDGRSQTLCIQHMICPQ